MDQETYLKERVDDQLEWFESKSSYNQTRYKRLKTVTMTAAVLIPFLSGFSIENDYAMVVTIIIGALGVVVAITEGLLSIHKYEENWVQYRTTSELLKREKLFFETKAGHYAGTDQNFPVFVQNVEKIINSDTSAWKNYITEETGTD